MPINIFLKQSLLFALLLAFTSIAGLPANAENAFLRPWPASREAPALKLDDLNEKAWDLSALRGKVIVLNFWATWCEPCVEEIPFLNDLLKERAKDGLLVLGINFKESPSLIGKFLTEHKFDYPVLMDRSGDSFKKWGDSVLPATVLIDRKGKARWKVVGALDRNNKEFRQTLERLLEE